MTDRIAEIRAHFEAQNGVYMSIAAADVLCLITALDAAQARARELEAALVTERAWLRNAVADDAEQRKAAFRAGAEAMRRVAVEIAASSPAAALGPRATAHAIGGAPLPEPESEVG